MALALALAMALAMALFCCTLCRAYDQSTIQFHPSGRLLQVEYAQQAVDNGRLVVALKCSDGVIVCAVKSAESSPLLLKRNTPHKMFTIDEHIHCTASGLMFDATALVQECQSFAAAYTSLFGCRIPVQRLVAEICEQKQQSTQLGGLRPFGASLVIVGWDGQGFQLYTTSPGGSYHSWKACAVGKGASEALEVLQSEYKTCMTMEAAWSLAIKILQHYKEREWMSSSRAVENTDTELHSILELATLTKGSDGQLSWWVYSDDETAALLQRHTTQN